MHDPLFTNDQIRLDILRQRSLNMRWASLPEDVIPLTSADPDFPPAQEILDVLREYLDGGYMPYVSPRGMTGLRETLAEGAWHRKKERVDPQWILPTDSAARAMQIIAAAVLAPGDEAVIFDPVDLMFGVSVAMAGGKPIYYPCVKTDGRWNFSDLESFITPRTRMLCFCNPHNPLGKVYAADELRTILEIANRRDLYIMNDEVWSDIVYSEQPFISLMSFEPELTQKVLTVYGFSKGFSMAGIRGGYLVCPDDRLFPKVLAVSGVENTVGGVSCLTQVAMKAAFERAFPWVDRFVAHLQSCRDQVYVRLNAMPGIRALRQEATFVSFFDVRGTGMSSEEFVDFMLRSQRVALVPGTKKWFGPGAEGYVRLCYSTSHELIDEALDRMEDGLRRRSTQNTEGGTDHVQKQ